MRRDRPIDETQPGRGLRRSVQGLAAGLALLGIGVGAASWGQGWRAERQREAIGWPEFRADIEAAIAEAEDLAERVRSFDTEAALREARAHRMNGFTHRFLEHLAKAELTGAGPTPLPAGGRRDRTSLGDERREGFGLRPGESVRFAVDLPAEPLELMLGVGSEAAPAGSLEVRVEFGGRSAVLEGMPAAEAGRWIHARRPLPEWATGAGWVGFRHTGAADAGAEDAAIHVGDPLIFGRPERRLNVLLVLEDTLRSDHLSGYGYHRETSPVKDAFFRDGVVFEHPFSQAYATLMSCTSMMTSWTPSATGVRRNGDRLPEAALTLAEILRDQGYATASIIQNPYAGPYGGLDQGFERVRLSPDDNRRVKSREIYEERALQWLDEFKGRNTFLYLHVFDPHHPYDVAPVFVHDGAQPSGDVAGEVDDPLRLEGEPDGSDLTPPESDRFEYGGEIRANDFSFGLLLDGLEERGLLDGTLVIFLSDHGEYFGEEDRRQHSAPGFIHVLHVPLMMRHPGLLPGGLRIDEPVQLGDVMPTILDLLEIPTAPFPLTGDSLLPLIRGETGAAERWSRRVILSEEAEGGASFIRGPWHVIGSPSFMSNYVKFKTYSGLRLAWTWWRQSGEQVRVFNYAEDRQERRGLGALARDASFRIEVVELRERMKDALAGLHEAIREEAPEEAEINPETLETLKHMGYL